MKTENQTGSEEEHQEADPTEEIERELLALEDELKQKETEETAIKDGLIQESLMVVKGNRGLREKIEVSKKDEKLVNVVDQYEKKIMSGIQSKEETIQEQGRKIKDLKTLADRLAPRSDKAREYQDQINELSRKLQEKEESLEAEKAAAELSVADYRQKMEEWRNRDQENASDEVDFAVQTVLDGYAHTEDENLKADYFSYKDEIKTAVARTLEAEIAPEKEEQLRMTNKVEQEVKAFEDLYQQSADELKSIKEEIDTGYQSIADQLSSESFLQEIRETKESILKSRKGWFKKEDKARELEKGLDQQKQEIHSQIVDLDNKIKHYNNTVTDPHNGNLSISFHDSIWEANLGFSKDYTNGKSTELLNNIGSLRTQYGALSKDAKSYRERSYKRSQELLSKLNNIFQAK